MKPEELGLPHRPPFVFIDDILEIDPGQSARGEKSFHPDDPLFGGHFPGNPLVPGVLLTEALAQVAGIAAGQEGRRFLLSAIRAMKFPSAARPGERVELRATKTGAMGGLWMFDTRATVGNQVVAEGAIVLNEVTE